MFNVYDLYEYRSHDFYSLSYFYWRRLWHWKSQKTELFHPIIHKTPKMNSSNCTYSRISAFFERNLALGNEQRGKGKSRSVNFFIIITIIVLSDKKPQLALQNINIYVIRRFMIVKKFADENPHKNKLQNAFGKKRRP